MPHNLFERRDSESHFLIDLIFKPEAPHSKLRPEEIQLLLSYVGEILKEIQDEEKLIIEEEKKKGLFNLRRMRRMVHNLYHNDPYARTVETTVLQTFEEDGKKFISLQDSLFYPQGGGQKGDRGTIAVREQSFTVINTVKDPLASSGQAHCIVEGDIGSVSAGMPAKANLNWDHRYKQMRLHSTVHLHHAVMETIAGQPLKYPMTSELQDDGTAYNRYDGDEITEELAIAAIEKMLGIIKDGSAITTRDDLEKVGYRYWESCGYVIPCGGTHLKDLKEIGAISGDFSRKKGRSKILFQLKD